MTDETMNSDPQPTLTLSGNAYADSRERQAHFAELTAWHERHANVTTATLAPGAARPPGPQEAAAGAQLAGHPEMLELSTLLAARKGPDGRRLAETDPTYRARLESTQREIAAGRQPSAESRKLLEDLRAADEIAEQFGPDPYQVTELPGGWTVNNTDPGYLVAAGTASRLGLSREQFAGMLDLHAQLMFAGEG